VTIREIAFLVIGVFIGLPLAVILVRWVYRKAVEEAVGRGLGW